jgi:hypothetical protein
LPVVSRHLWLSSAFFRTPYLLTIPLSPALLPPLSLPICSSLIPMPAPPISHLASPASPDSCLLRSKPLGQFSPLSAHPALSTGLSWIQLEVPETSCTVWGTSGMMPGAQVPLGTWCQSVWSGEAWTVTSQMTGAICASEFLMADSDLQKILVVRCK